MGSGKKQNKNKSKTKSVKAAGSKEVKISAVGSSKEAKTDKTGGGKAAKSDGAGDSKAVQSKTAAGGNKVKKVSTGKKSGRSAKSRNPNLKLVKTEDTPKAESAKKSSEKESAKKDSLEEVSAKKGASQKASAKKESSEKTSAKTSEKKSSSEKAFAKKEAPKKAAAKKSSSEKASVKKESPQKTSAKKNSSEKASAKKSALKTVSAKKASSGKGSGKKSSRKAKQKERSYASQSYIEYDDKTYTDRPGIVEWFIQHKSLVIIWLTVIAVIAALAGGCYYVITNYKVTTVYVDGNIHYTNEEIMDMVMTGAYGNNSLYLAMKYKDKGVEGVPFVEKMDVDILTPNTIRISVYEKALAGYVEYLGRYMYFDRDGIIVESSQSRTEGIPQVTGLKFGYVVLNEALPVENDAVFKRILSITQLLDKYELTADKIYFDSDYNLTLFFDGVQVTLGGSEEIDEKIMRLQYILPELAGKTGRLSMENYTEDSKLIPFRSD